MTVPTPSRTLISRVLGTALVLVAATLLVIGTSNGPAAPEFGTGRVLPESESRSGPEPDADERTTHDTVLDGVTDVVEEASPPDGGRSASPFTTTAPRGPIDMATWPSTVAIPTLGIAAPVQAVGVGSEGELIVPASPMDVGWYQGGAVPGEPGVALLTSHVDTRSEGRGVFAGLVEVGPGDSVLLETADGAGQRWVVVARSQHRKDELPAELFSRSGPPVLALVTCGGPFDRERRSYRDNIIVWAELSS